MKYLSDYTEELNNELMDKCGAFFAFNREQFEEGCLKVGANKNNKIASLDNGFYVLSKNVDELIDGLNKINENAIKQDILENGIVNIIHRELANHEAQISNSIESTVDALEDYGISKQQISDEYKIYIQKCIDNDYF